MLAYERVAQLIQRQLLLVPLAEHDQVDVAGGQVEARLEAAEYVHLRVRPLALDHARDLVHHLVAHDELLRSGRNVAREQDDLVVQPVIKNAIESKYKYIERNVTKKEEEQKTTKENERKIKRKQTKLVMINGVNDLLVLLLAAAADCILHAAF